MKTNLNISLKTSCDEIKWENKMVLMKYLPICSHRYGRIDTIDLGNGGKIYRPILCCEHREVDPEECIACWHVIHH